MGILSHAISNALTSISMHISTTLNTVMYSYTQTHELELVERTNSPEVRHD